MRRYLDLLRAPGVAPLVAAATLGRLRYGMNVLALILLLRAEGFGYAEDVAGASLGTWLAGALVDAVSVESALACAPAFAAAGLLIALSGRRSLAARLPR